MTYMSWPPGSWQAEYWTEFCVPVTVPGTVYWFTAFADPGTLADWWHWATTLGCWLNTAGFPLRPLSTFATATAVICKLSADEYASSHCSINSKSVSVHFWPKTFSATSDTERVFVESEGSCDGHVRYVATSVASWPSANEVGGGIISPWWLILKLYDTIHACYTVRILKYLSINHNHRHNRRYKTPPRRSSAKGRQTTLRWQKQVFIHTRLSRAYLALAGLSS